MATYWHHFFLTLMFLMEAVTATPFATETSADHDASTNSNSPLMMEHLDLGDCIAFTLNGSEYTRDSDGRLLIKTDQTVVAEHGQYQISTEDGTAHVCYPISKELQMCQHRVFLPQDDYEMLPNRVLGHLNGDYVLGTYFIMADGVAVVCHSNTTVKDVKKIAKRPRRACNFIILSPEEHRIDEQRRLWLLTTNEELPVANYTLDPTTNIVNACYPLTKEFLNCNSWWLLQSREIEILPNKKLFSKPHQETYDHGDYFLTEGNRAVTCSIQLPQPSNFKINILQTIAQIASAIFLAVAIIIHLLLPGLSYQRAPLLCHAISLCITYICLATRPLHIPARHTNCYLVFFFTNYFALAAFCWLSILAFDLWRISSSLRKGTEAYHWVTSFHSKKFLKYSIVGWGVPLLLTMVVLLVDHQEDLQDTLGLYPQIAAQCWFNERPSGFAFFYGPICFSLAFNFVLIAQAVRNIWHASQYAEFTNMKLNKQLLAICSIVFLAMGLFWIMEVVSYGKVGDGLRWLVPDLINALQGVIIAVVYTCRPITWRLLKEKYHSCLGSKL